MHYPDVIRRLGAVPGLLRLVSIVLECISVVLLTTRQRPGEGYITDYMIVGCLRLIPDSASHHCLFRLIDWLTDQLAG